MSKTRNSQGSTCPEGWRKAGIKVPVSLTVKQEQYASRSVGIARAVFNLVCRSVINGTSVPNDYP